MRKIIRTYIAGAYSADNVMDVLANMRRGIRLGTKAILSGFSAYIPWLDHLVPIVASTVTEEMLKANSMAWLEVSDALLIVPEGLDESKGTQAEMKRAEELGIPIFFNLDDLVEWAQNGAKWQVGTENLPPTQT